MKKIIVTGMCTCLSMLSFSQQNTVSNGGDATGTGGTVSYSIGQIDYIHSQGSNGSINQGVQQPFEFFDAVGIGEHEALIINLFPNPTNEYITLSWEAVLDNSNYTLIDSKGRIVAQGGINNIETQIDVRACSAGEYHLSISRNNEKIQTSKIIKY